jgi:hypothetical protein
MPPDWRARWASCTGAETERHHAPSLVGLRESLPSVCQTAPITTREAVYRVWRDGMTAVHYRTSPNPVGVGPTANSEAHPLASARHRKASRTLAA